MQTDDLLNRAKAGDEEALIAWSRSFAPAIAQFAYQAGIAEENISYFRLQVLKDFSNNIKAIEIYEKLSLQNPSKSAYFAAKIDQL